MRQVDVAVIGSGVIGAATAWQLSGSGQSVVLLEQFEVGHGRGSSHGPSRIFRYSYPDPGYVAMAMEALPLWRRLEAESGRAIVTTTGGLDWGKDLDAHTSALSSCGARFDLIEGGEARRRFPALAPPDGTSVLYQPDTAVIAADLAVRTFVERAVAGGVELQEGLTVRGLQTDGERVRIRTDGGDLETRVAVVTAGAWARALLSDAGIDLPVEPSRQTVAYFPAMGDPPPVVIDWSQGTVFYALPSPGTGVKVGEHRIGPTADPDEEAVADAGWVAALESWVAKRLPGVTPTAVHAETCLYTNTSDERFILERHGPIVVGSACSGHAFKFAPLIGQRLVTLIMDHGG